MFPVYQAHYRLGSSLAGLKRYTEAMHSFATALDLAETEEEKYDTLLQITTVAPEARGRYLALGATFFPISQGFHWAAEIRECSDLYAKFSILISWAVFSHIYYTVHSPVTSHFSVATT